MGKWNSELKSINLLLQNSSIIYEGDIKGYPNKLININSGILAFIGNDQIKIYAEETENLYYKIKEISDFFSVKTFNQYLLHDFIPMLKRENRISEEKDVELFISHFKNQQLEKFTISREIHGIHIKNKIIIGDFTIINSLTNDEISSKFSQLCDIDEIPNFSIEVNTFAKDIDKAVEIANLKFAQFENIIAFMIGDLYRKKNVKILNNLDTSSDQILLSVSNKITQHERSNLSLIIDLEDKYFTDIDNVNGKIWELFLKDKTTDLEKRIKNTIEWTGKALKDDNKSKVLIQFMFAIECALHIQPKNSIINSSILSLISDNIAFLLYEDYDQRRMESLTFKDLYQKRSDIVHGSNQNVKFQDLNNALRLCKLIVRKLIMEEPYSSFCDAQKLGEYLTNQKFK